VNREREMYMSSPQNIESFVNEYWDREIVPTIVDYIKIPNKSPVFDREWESKGHMEDALQLALKWIQAHPVPGAKLHVGRAEGRTPLILLDIPGTADGTVLLYGHLDKQPEMTGWREDLGPWKPVMEDGKLYGRGGADDGYALFASICAISALKQWEIPHARCVVMIEFSEESGSPDLPHYVDHFSDIIGHVDLVVCLDSGAGNYDQLWSTNSLRGLVAATLRVDVLNEGVHSGDASGVVASSFRVLQSLVSRLEDTETGQIKPDALKVEIPAQRVEQARVAAEALGHEVYSKFPFVSGMQPMHHDHTQLVLNRTWRAAVSYTGQRGMPDVDHAGNVLRPFSELQLSLRLPPTLPAEPAQDVLEQLLTTDVPYGAKASVEFQEPATGWNAPALAGWLDDALNQVSRTYYGKPAIHMGEGGSIPFMGMLGEKFPDAQFVVTGVLGPASNAHGPNEFLHVPYAKKLTSCVVDLLKLHAKHAQS